MPLQIIPMDRHAVDPMQPVTVLVGWNHCECPQCDGYAIAIPMNAGVGNKHWMMDEVRQEIPLCVGQWERFVKACPDEMRPCVIKVGESHRLGYVNGNKSKIKKWMETLTWRTVA